MAIENTKLKLFKVLSCSNNALYDSSKFFLFFFFVFTTSYPAIEDMGPLDILR